MTQAPGGLGRLYAPDERDEKFLMQAVVPKATTKTYRYWNDLGWWGDQGSDPHCVGFAWTHWIEDGPVTHGGDAPIVDPNDLYREAQEVDEWPGEAYDGTSVRAGAKILQSRGLVGEYRWAFDLDTVVRTLLETGPVVVGTWWYESMFAWDAESIIQISSGTARAGGHAYVLNGINTSKELIRIKNSWGREWADGGRAWISMNDMETLIKEEGEACLALETKSK